MIAICVIHIPTGHEPGVRSVPWCTAIFFQVTQMDDFYSSLFDPARDLEKRRDLLEMCWNICNDSFPSPGVAKSSLPWGFFYF